MICDLPEELLLHIIFKIDDPKSIAALGGVCRLFRRLTQDELSLSSFFARINTWNLDFQGSWLQKIHASHCLKNKLHQCLALENPPPHIAPLLGTWEVAQAFLKSHVDAAWETLPEILVADTAPDVDPLVQHLGNTVHQITHPTAGLIGLGFKTAEVTAFLFIHKERDKPYWGCRYDVAAPGTRSLGTLMQNGRLQSLQFTPYNLVFRTILPNVLSSEQGSN